MKLYRLLDCSDDTKQVCYYQPGVGIGGDFDRCMDGFVQKVAWSNFKNIWDSMVAFSLDTHIVSAYLFLMEHYQYGDRVYMFGFSRGAFIARVLAGMIGRVGLLNKSLDHLVKLAWRIYRCWEFADQPSQSNYTTTLVDEFKNIFCRDYEVRIYFQGLFDSVNSVGILRDRLFPFTQRSNIVDHVRHCISIDERRGKFKQQCFAPNPYLPKMFSLQYKTYVLDHDDNYKSGPFSTTNRSNELLQETLNRKGNNEPYHTSNETTQLSYKTIEGIFKICSVGQGGNISASIKDASMTPDLIEKWFIGDHSDVGGGWALDKDEVNNRQERLSTIPLKWIIGESIKHGVKFKRGSIHEFSKRHYMNSLDSIMGKIHDHLIFSKVAAVSEHDTDETGQYLPREIKYSKGGLPNRMMTLLWWLLEFLPIGLRIENKKGKWRNVYVPNLGRHRCIPEYGDLHWSVYWRIKFDDRYRPKNLPGYSRELIKEFQNIELGEDSTSGKGQKTIMSHFKSYPGDLKGSFVSISSLSRSNILSNGIIDSYYYQLRAQFLKWEATKWEEIPDDLTDWLKNDKNL